MKNIVFDLDSTLVTIEGINELAALKNVKKQIAELTNRAMNGDLPLEDVFLKRLKIIKPSKADLELIGNLYLKNITDYAELVVKSLRKRNNIFIISGGYETAIRGIASKLEVKAFFANQIIFNSNGSYQKINRSIPLWKNSGKTQVIEKIKKEYPTQTIMIGDSISDLETSADQFICFVGVVRRQKVIKRARHIITDLRELLEILS